MTEILPYPDFPLVFPDGKEVKRFDKLLLAGDVGGKKIVTTQLQPIHYWGYDYQEEPALSYAKIVSNKIIESCGDLAVITGDFQVSQLDQPFLDLYKRLDLKDALPDRFTRMRQNGKHTRSDHILIKKDRKVIDSEVKETMTDHFLCYVEIE